MGCCRVPPSSRAAQDPLQGGRATQTVVLHPQRSAGRAATQDVEGRSDADHGAACSPRARVLCHPSLLLGTADTHEQELDTCFPDLPDDAFVLDGSQGSERRTPGVGQAGDRDMPRPAAPEGPEAGRCPAVQAYPDSLPTAPKRRRGSGDQEQLARGDAGHPESSHAQPIGTPSGTHQSRSVDDSGEPGIVIGLHGHMHVRRADVAGEDRYAPADPRSPSQAA